MYTKNCPNCNKELFYISENNKNKSIEINSLCRSCSKKKYNNDFYNLQRNCPICNCIIKYKRTSDKIVAVNKKSLCKKCSFNNGKFKKSHNLNDLYNNSSNNLLKLLEETYESFYWLGFIIADGTISDKDGKHIFELALSSKDLNHLIKFSNFINFDKEIKFKSQTNSYRIAFSDRHSINLVKTKYDLKNKKTYNPINFNCFLNYDIELLLCLLIGIIDGDGYIGKNGSKNGRIISIVSHKSWRDFFTKLLNAINLNSFFHINDVSKTNKILVNLYKKEIILFLKEKTIKYNLPVLNRKWDRLKI